jgi:hypothetical protein
LEGSEESVELGEVGELADLLLFDGFDDGGEAALEVWGRKGEYDGGEHLLIHLMRSVGRSRTAFNLGSNTPAAPYTSKVGGGQDLRVDCYTYHRVRETNAIRPAIWELTGPNQLLIAIAATDKEGINGQHLRRRRYLVEVSALPLTEVESTSSNRR